MKWTFKVSAFSLLLGLAAEPAQAYIDPQTTHTVISGLGAILAAIGAGFLGGIALLRRQIVGAWRSTQRALRSLGRPGIALILGLAVITLWTFRKELPMAGKWAAQAEDRRRVILLGIDGMDPELTRELMAEGRLPSFAQLAELGDFQPLATVNPVQSPVVWTTMATGVGPGVHGIADFITRRKNTYVPDLSLMRRNEKNPLGRLSSMFAPPVDPKLFFWETMASQGVKARVLRWPLTFPPKGESAVLSGLGTPDALGSMGRYTLYTTAPERVEKDIKGDVMPLSFTDGVAKTKIRGPQVAKLRGKDESSAELIIKKGERPGTVDVNVGDDQFTLGIGRVSPWARVSFPLGFGVKASAMVHFILIEANEQLALYMSPVHIDPADPVYPVSTHDLAQNLASNLGRYHTLGMAEDTNALADGIIDEDMFLATCDALLRESERLFWHELSRTKSGFYSFVFDTLDRVQHMFWRFRDPLHPLHDAELAERYGKVISDHYERMDRLVGELLRVIDHQNDTLLIVSDHGFTSYRRNFHVNTWLINQGYMVLKDGETTVDGLFRNVDWSKTRAFALGFSQIFLNIAGRDEHGIVPPAEVPALKKELMAKLRELKDTRVKADPVVEVYDAAEVFRTDLKAGPDLLVGMARGYRFSWQTAVGGAPAYEFEDNDKRWSGDHCVDPSHVPGVIFSNRRLNSQNPSVLDIAPTALALFDITTEREYLGRSLF